MARALTTGDATPLVPLLRGGDASLSRLAIHQRHYEASLVRSILDKFPATTWLLGSEAVTGAARSYVRARPPNRPCIAEYGRDFPAFLAGNRDVIPPCTWAFAKLEWAVAQASIAITEPPLAWADLVALGPVALPDVTLALQAGLHYVRASHAVDDLMRLYLTNTAPERFTLEPGITLIQVRGARGEIEMARLDAGTFVLRASMRGGRPLGDSVGRAFQADPTFDPTSALQALFAEGLVAAVVQPQRGEA